MNLFFSCWLKYLRSSFYNYQLGKDRLWRTMICFNNVFCTTSTRWHLKLQTNGHAISQFIITKTLLLLKIAMSFIYHSCVKRLLRLSKWVVYCWKWRKVNIVLSIDFYLTFFSGVISPIIIVMWGPKCKKKEVTKAVK